MADANNLLKPNGQIPHQDTEENQDPQFAIQRIYAKDLSFETPHSPAIFQEEWKPNVDVQLNASTQKLSVHVYEVKLSITVTTKVHDKTAFLVEAHTAGIFTIAHFAELQLNHMLGSYCPSILFPYARELISDLVSRGGFPPFYLAPINFEALYEQHLAQQNQPPVNKDMLN